MKHTKYIGTFISHDNNHSYTLEVYCFSFIEAFFLLTAKAIESGRHYQLNKIVSEKGDIKYIADILKVAELFS